MYTGTLNAFSDQTSCLFEMVLRGLPAVVHVLYREISFFKSVPRELSEGTSPEKEAGSSEPGIARYQYCILGVSSALLISL